MEMLANVFWQS